MVVHETVSNVDVHRKALCCKGVIHRFLFLWPERVIYEAGILRTIGVKVR